MQNCTEHFTPKLNQPCGSCSPWGHPQMGLAQGISNILHLGIHMQQGNCWKGFAHRLGLFALFKPSWNISVLLDSPGSASPLQRGFFPFLIWLQLSTESSCLHVGKEWLLSKVHKMKPAFVAPEEKQLEMTSPCGQELPVLPRGTSKGHLELQQSKPKLHRGFFSGHRSPHGCELDIPESYQFMSLTLKIRLLFHFQAHNPSFPSTS